MCVEVRLFEMVLADTEYVRHNRFKVLSGKNG